MLDVLNSRLSIRTRLLLVSGLFATAVVFATALLVTQARDGIAFSQKESDGLAVINDLWNGTKQGSAINTAAVTPYARADQADAVAAAGSEPERLDALLTLISAVADGSNLTLDPDLDSFYAMDAVTIRIPNALAKARAFYAQLGTVGDPASYDVMVKVAARDLTGAMSAAVNSLSAAMANNAQGLTRAALSKSIDEFERAGTALAASGGSGKAGESMAAFEAAADGVWRAASAELERLLAQRIDGMESQLTTRLILIALGLALALTMAWIISSGLARRFKALTSVMGRMREGHFDTAVPFKTDGHETGAIAQTLQFLSDATAARAAEDERRRLEAEHGTAAILLAISKSQAVIEFKPDGTILDANDIFCKTLGYGLDEIKGRHHSIFVTDAYRQSQEYRTFWDRLNAGQTVTDKLPRITKGGKEIWIQASYCPVVGSDGKVGKIVKFATDITAEESVAREAVYKSAAFAGSSVAMMMMDRDFKVTYVNDATRRLMTENVAAFRALWPSFNPEAIVGMCIDTFHKNPAHQRQMLSDTSRLPFRTDISVGDLKFALNVSAVLDNKGAYVGNVLQWDNVTVARTNAGMLNAIDRNQAVIEFTLDGTIVKANENFCNALGYSLSEIQGKHHAMFVDPEYRQSAEYRGFWEGLARGEFKVGKFSRTSKNGKQIWIQASYNPIVDGNGKPFKVVKFASDITESENARIAAEADSAARAAEQAEVVASLASGLKLLSEGDLTERLTKPFTGSYESLRSDFNSALDNLQKAMQTISSNAGGIRSGASEISQAADDLSRRTEQQAASLEETAAALDEITATVRKTAEGAKLANNVALSTRTGAEASGEVVRQTVDAMAEIEKSSRQISQIIGVIDEIAFQTNLLALNAGVEAARAGDAGRGFAVVASEVRSLAQRSSQAAKEIKSLISASTQHVESGVKLVGEAGTSLKQIVERVAEMSGLVSEISASTQEQSTALAEVNTAINQMDQVTQQNAAMVEQSTAASHSLNQEAEALLGLISHFKSGDDQGMAAPAQAPQRAKPHAPAKPKPQGVMEQKRRVAQFAAAGGGASRGGEQDWEEF